MIEKYGVKVLVIAGLALLVIGLLVLNQCSALKNAKTETKISKGQAGAALESGRDAVNTIGNQAASEIAGDAITRENYDAITNAQGASAVVDPGVRGAGLASLCRRAVYRNDPKCVQHAPAR